jgi:hypothetical protein
LTCEIPVISFIQFFMVIFSENNFIVTEKISFQNAQTNSTKTLYMKRHVHIKRFHTLTKEPEKRIKLSCNSSLRKSAKYKIAPNLNSKSDVLAINTFCNLVNQLSLQWRSEFILLQQ